MFPKNSSKNLQLILTDFFGGMEQHELEKYKHKQGLGQQISFMVYDFSQLNA
jgi:hypothetical protein